MVELSGDLTKDVKTFDTMHNDDVLTAEEKQFGEKLSAELKKQKFEETAADVDLKLAYFSGQTKDVQYSDVSHQAEGTFHEEGLKDNGFGRVEDKDLKGLVENISTVKDLPTVKLHGNNLISIEYVDGEGNKKKVYAERGGQAFETMYALGQYYQMLQENLPTPPGPPD